MLSALFDGSGPLAAQTGAHRVAEPLAALLQQGSEAQRAVARQSVVEQRQLSVERASTVEFHDRIASGALTEDSFLRGRALAERLGYPTAVVDALPDRIVERFIGLANPFALGQPGAGATVVDVGCGAGFDAEVARTYVGPTGRVVGVDASLGMTQLAGRLRLGDTPTCFANSFGEQLPIASNSADLVLSNGVFNLTDRPVVLAECLRILRPGGRLQFGDMTCGHNDWPGPVVDYISFHQNRLTERRWVELLSSVGFVDVEFAKPVDPFLADHRPMRGQAVAAVKAQ